MEVSTVFLLGGAEISFYGNHLYHDYEYWYLNEATDMSR